MSDLGGGSETTQTTQLTPEQEAFAGVQTRISEQQLKAIRANRRFLRAQIQELERRSAAEEISREDFQTQLAEIQELERGLLGFQEGLVTGPIGTPSAEQLENIETVRRESLAAATSDIDAAVIEANRRITQEFAPSAGLSARRGDAPVFNRLDLSEREGVRAKAQAANLAAAQAAGARLELPLQEFQLRAGATQGAVTSAQAADALRQQLIQNAFVNRSQLANLGLAFSAQAAGTGPGFAPPGGTVTQSVSKQLGLGEILSAAGAGLTGLGDVGVRF